MELNWSEKYQAVQVIQERMISWVVYGCLQQFRVK